MLIFRAASIQVRRLPNAGEDDQDGDERRPAVFQVGPAARGRQRTRLPHGQLLGSQRAGVEKRERNPGIISFDVSNQCVVLGFRLKHRMNSVTLHIRSCNKRLPGV